MRRALLVSVAVWGALTLGAGPVRAAPEDVVNDITQKITSPFCPGVTLHDCPSSAAAELRNQISGWAEAGWGRDRIMARLEAEYGPEIRAVPPASGTGLAAWVLPLVALASGSAIAVVLVRRWSEGARRLTDTEHPSSNSLSLSPADRRRLDDELAAFKGR